MSTSYPRFTATPPAERDVGFVIDGTYGPKHEQAGEAWEEVFECVPDLPAVSITEGRLALRLAEGKMLVQAGPASRFIANAVVESERARFEELIHDHDRLIDSELIGDVFEHLWGVYSDRPTKPAGGSDSGRANTPATSKGA